jgi:hypothetical protein
VAWLPFLVVLSALILEFAPKNTPSWMPHRCAIEGSRVAVVATVKIFDVFHMVPRASLCVVYESFRRSDIPGTYWRWSNQILRQAPHEGGSGGAILFYRHVGDRVKPAPFNEICGIIFRLPSAYVRTADHAVLKAAVSYGDGVVASLAGIPSLCRPNA